MHKNFDKIRNSARCDQCFPWQQNVFSNVFDRIHFILAVNDDIHKTLNEFEIRRDPTMGYGVGCP